MHAMAVRQPNFWHTPLNADTSPQRFLVIGSNSFSGAQFIKYLLRHEHQVLGVSRSAELHPVFLPYLALNAGQRFRFAQVDINTQLDELMALVREFEPEYVVNFAAQGMVAQSWEWPEHWYQTNVVGQVKLHDQLRKQSHIRRYVHISTPRFTAARRAGSRRAFTLRRARPTPRPGPLATCT
jgi:dTDP-glucose 4,6-dehydratase